MAPKRKVEVPKEKQIKKKKESSDEEEEEASKPDETSDAEEQEQEKEELEGMKYVKKVKRIIGKKTIDNLGEEAVKRFRKDTKGDEELEEELELLHHVPAAAYTPLTNHPPIDETNNPRLSFTKSGKWSYKKHKLHHWPKEHRADLEKYKCDPGDVSLLIRLFRNPLSMRDLIKAQIETFKHQVCEKYAWIVYYYLELALEVDDPWYIQAVQLFLIMFNSRSADMFYQNSNEDMFRAFYSRLDLSFSELAKSRFQINNTVSVLKCFIEPLRVMVENNSYAPGVEAATIHSVETMAMKDITIVNPEDFVEGLRIKESEYIEYAKSSVFMPLVPERMDWDTDAFWRAYYKQIGMPDIKIFREDPTRVATESNDGDLTFIDVMSDFAAHKKFLTHKTYMHLYKQYQKDHWMHKGKNEEKKEADKRNLQSAL